MTTELIAAGFEDRWTQHIILRNGIFVEFTPPNPTSRQLIIVTSLIGETNVWTVLGGSSAYPMGGGKYRVLVGFAPPFSTSLLLTPTHAKNWKWRISWAAFSDISTDRHQPEFSTLSEDNY